jgi:hypothetical protein
MVAITVILAAVIGAFVLEIGDQQETAPSTSFDTEESTHTIVYDGSEGPRTWRYVSATHAGGEVTDFTQVSVRVEGNESVYNAIQDPNNANGGDYYPSIPLQNPYFPAVNQDCPPGEACEWVSGESIRMMFYGEIGYENSAHHPWSNNNYLQAGWPGKHVNLTSTRIHGYTVPNVQQGDTTNVVWSAESGGKTQTLFKYTVQGAR